MSYKSYEELLQALRTEWKKMEDAAAKMVFRTPVFDIGECDYEMRWNQYEGLRKYPRPTSNMILYIDPVTGETKRAPDPRIDAEVVAFDESKVKKTSELAKKYLKAVQDLKKELAYDLERLTTGKRYRLTDTSVIAGVCDLVPFYVECVAPSKVWYLDASMKRIAPPGPAGFTELWSTLNGLGYRGPYKIEEVK